MCDVGEGDVAGMGRYGYGCTCLGVGGVWVQMYGCVWVWCVCRYGLADVGMG